MYTHYIWSAVENGKKKNKMRWIISTRSSEREKWNRNRFESEKKNALSNALLKGKVLSSRAENFPVFFQMYWICLQMLFWVVHFLCAATLATHFDGVLRHICKNHILFDSICVRIFPQFAPKIKTKTNNSNNCFAPLFHTHTHKQNQFAKCRMPNAITHTHSHIFVLPFLFSNWFDRKATKAKQKKIPNNYDV